MKLILTSFFAAFAVSAFAQKINYLNSNFVQVEYKDQASYYTETSKTTPYSGIVKTFYIDGVLISEESFSDLNRKKRDGLSKNFYPSGSLRSEVNFKAGVFHGPLKTYYPNQRLKRAEMFENGETVQGKCFNQSGYDTTFFAFQQPPRFTGGMPALQAYLAKASRYPLTVINGVNLRQGFADYVIVRFMVTPEGKITDAMVVSRLNKFYDTEALRLVNLMPAWVPGKQDGESTFTEQTIAICFKRG